MPTKISELPEIVTLVNADIFTVVDVSAVANYKITLENLASNVAGAFASNAIPWAAIDTTALTFLDYLGSAVQGNIVYYDGSDWVLLAPGTDGDVLTTHGAAADPTWETGAISIGSPSQGDVIYYDGSDWANLAAGGPGQFLKTLGAGYNPTWGNAVAYTGTPAAGTMLYHDGADWVTLAVGSVGQVLATDGVDPIWNDIWQNTPVEYGSVYAGATGGFYSTAAGTTGQVLTANTGAAPTWNDIWQNTPVEYGAVYAGATGGFYSTAAGLSGQLLQSNGASAPTWVNNTLTSGTRGDILFYGASGWEKLTAPATTSNNILSHSGTGADPYWARGPLISGGGPTGTPAIVYWSGSLYTVTGAGTDTQVLRANQPAGTCSWDDELGITKTVNDLIWVQYNVSGNIFASLAAGTRGQVLESGEGTSTSEGPRWVDADTVFDGWVTIDTSKYTATPASLQQIDMSDSSDMHLGAAIKYTYDGTIYYGIVDAVSGSYIYIAGPPLDTGEDITELQIGSSNKVVTKEFFISGTYGDSTDTSLLKNDMDRYFRWESPEVKLVAFSVTQDTVDTGTEPKINILNDTVRVSTADSGNGAQLSGAGVWVDINRSSIDPDEYTFNYRSSVLEIECTVAGGTGDAADLTVSCVFVYV